MKKSRDELIFKLKSRKKISKMGWAVKWKSGDVSFFRSKRIALSEMEFYSYVKSTLFRCKIEEVTR